MEEESMEVERRRARSPNYPAFGLHTAIELARRFYERDGKVAVAPVAAVRAWDYNSLNGRSLRVLGALRQYGLLEDTPQKMVKLSPLALNLLLAPKSTKQYRDALTTAAFTPAVFSRLREEYEGEFPSDDSMVHRLVAHDAFNEEAARGLIASLRDTISLVSEATKDHPSVPDNSNADEAPDTGRTHEHGTKRKEVPMSDIGRESLDFPFPLVSGGQAILRLPRSMTQRDYTMLTTMIDSVLKGMRDALVETPLPTEGEE